jgi:predicted  nucleic acid-binding Zn-ribbon protein
MELNKTIQDLKMEVETMTKPQRETTPKIETLGKKSGTIDVSISNRIQEMEERILGAEDSIENIGSGPRSGSEWVGEQCGGRV